MRSRRKRSTPVSVSGAFRVGASGVVRWSVSRGEREFDVQRVTDPGFESEPVLYGGQAFEATCSSSSWSPASSTAFRITVAVEPRAVSPGTARATVPGGRMELSFGSPRVGWTQVVIIDRVDPSSWVIDDDLPRYAGELATVSVAGEDYWIGAFDLSDV